MKQVLRRSAMAGVALLATYAIAGCSTSETGAGQGTAQPKPYPITGVSQRKAAPALTGSTLSGASFRLADVRGKVVVLNFWAAWCGPCRAESTVLNGVETATAAHGVAFVGVDEKDSRSAAKTFTSARKVTYPSVFDPDGALAAGWPGSAGLPYTFILDRQGKIAVSVVGGVTAAQLQDAVLQVAGEK